MPPELILWRTAAWQLERVELLYRCDQVALTDGLPCWLLAYDLVHDPRSATPSPIDHLVNTGLVQIERREPWPWPVSELTICWRRADRQVIQLDMHVKRKGRPPRIEIVRTLNSKADRGLVRLNWPCEYIRCTPEGLAKAGRCLDLTASQRSYLQALYKLGAFDSESRRSSSTVAHKVGVSAAAARKALGGKQGLKGCGLADISEGAGGGAWLTPLGRVVAEQLAG